MKINLKEFVDIVGRINHETKVVNVLHSSVLIEKEIIRGNSMNYFIYRVHTNTW
jgi:hypothetical protein